MLSHLRPALTLLVMFTVLTGVAYPLAVTGIAQIALPAQANGSLIVVNGKTVGSRLIGQAVTSPRYFHPRPSATSASDPTDATKTVDAPYNASNSTGSNLGPTSKALAERVSASVAGLRSAGWTGAVPADIVTTSASGLDPHISPDSALAQVATIAAVRGIDADRIRALVLTNTEGRWLAFLGEPRVNVLALNIALDELK